MSATDQQIRSAITTYIAAWNEHDDAKRAELLTQSCTENVRMITAGKVISGRSELDALMRNFQHRCPDDRARLSSAIEVQHTAFRYTGMVQTSVNPPPPAAMEAGECNAEGQICLILSFIGLAPRPESPVAR